MVDLDWRNYLLKGIFQSEILGQFRLNGDRASDVSGGRICLLKTPTLKYSYYGNLRKPFGDYERQKTNMASF